MKKLPFHLESPVDNAIMYIIEYIAPFVYSIGLTPNMITSLGNICTVFFVYFFLENRYFLSALFFFLAYVFDCLDGYIARSYNMTTKFGDLYDHTSDFLKMIAYGYLLFKSNKKTFFIHGDVL